MIAFEAETEEDPELVEQQIASLFQLLMVTFQEEEREFLLGFHVNTGRYLTDRNAPVGRLVRLIEECWYDGDVLRVETFETFGTIRRPTFCSPKLFLYAGRTDVALICRTLWSTG
ncbi:hypothetical protein OVA29_11025 [Exiguobacterium sp. SL14]|nr:hypothetical protein [Exiguobacterium sp. SL14]MCY1691145.1 hypothetical protein [Exiguobacterium sp. SL14]